MQLMNIQNDLKRQSVFKRKKTQVTSTEENATLVILKNIMHETVTSQENYRHLLQSNKNSEV